MEDKDFLQLLDKYINGTASQADKQLLEAYYERLGNQQRPVEEVVLAKAQQRSLQQLQQTIHPPRVRRISWLRYAGAAALVALLVGGAVWWRYVGTGVRQLTVATTGQQVKRVKLPDASIVWLKGNSSLSYPTGFTGTQRKVQLKGEALFEVAPDAAHPFVVRSTRVRLTVLGTSFHVTDRAGTDSAQVTVLTGKVAVQPAEVAANTAEKAPAVIAANQRWVVTATHNTQAREVPQAALEPLTQQTEYDMHFESTPFEVIRQRMMKKFDVLILGDAANYKDCLVTGNFTAQPLQPTIDMLTTTLNARYEIKGDTILLHGNGCR